MSTAIGVSEDDVKRLAKVVFTCELTQEEIDTIVESVIYAMEEAEPDPDENIYARVLKKFQDIGAFNPTRYFGDQNEGE